MTDEKNSVVTTKYGNGGWQSFVGDELLPDSYFKRRYDAALVAKNYAENNRFIHRVLTNEGTVKTEVDYGKAGKRGGSKDLLLGVGDFFAQVASAVFGILGRH